MLGISLVQKILIRRICIDTASHLNRPRILDYRQLEAWYCWVLGDQDLQQHESTGIQLGDMWESSTCHKKTLIQPRCICKPLSWSTVVLSHTHALLSPTMNGIYVELRVNVVKMASGNELIRKVHHGEVLVTSCNWQLQLTVIQTVEACSCNRCVIIPVLQLFPIPFQGIYRRWE